MTKSAQRWVLAGVPAQKGGFQQRFQQGFQRTKGVPARFQQRVPGQNGVLARDSSRGSRTFVFPLFPCISARMPLLAPLVDWAQAARAAAGTLGYAGPDGLGCTDLTTHPDTKVVIPPGTTIARILLTRPLLAADKQLCGFTNCLHGVPEDNPHVPILQVRVHADVDDVIQSRSGRVNPTVNKTQRRYVWTEGTTLLFAAHKPTTKKAGKDMYPFKHPHLDTLRYVVDSKPAMSVPNYSLTRHFPYRWKPELPGLTTPMLMESEDAAFHLLMCHDLPLIGTSEPVQHVEIFPEVNEELSELCQTGNVFKEEFLPQDGDMLANIEIEADNVGHRLGGIFNVAGPSPNRPCDVGDRVAVYAMISTGTGGQEGLQLPYVVLWAQRVLQSLSTKYPGLFLVKVGYLRTTSHKPQLWHRDLPLELQTVGVEHAFSCFLPMKLYSPRDGRENMFVYGSGSGVPYLW